MRLFWQDLRRHAAGLKEIGVFLLTPGSARGVLRLLGVLMVALAFLSTGRDRTPPSALCSNSDDPELAAAALEQSVDRPAQYAWLSSKSRKAYEPLASRLPPPPGFQRVNVAVGSFADWLRHLPVEPAGTPVTDGRRKLCLPADHPSVAAVIGLQPHDLRSLTSANILIRLRAEYLWSAGLAEGVAFHFTSGHESTWQNWKSGERPVVKGREVQFAKSAQADDSRASYCGYLETLFCYASTYSLLDETRAADDHALEIGDVFLRPGRPGHALMVLDAATHDGQEVRVLLGQGGTPPRTFHVIRGPDGSPWFTLAGDQPIDLGELGTFSMRQLRHWAR